MKRLMLQILAISVLVAGCSKEIRIENSNQNDDKEKHAAIQKQINTFSKLLDKKIKSASLTKAPAPQQKIPAEFINNIREVITTDFLEIEQQYFWLRDAVELQTVNIAKDLPHLNEATSELQAFNIIESNLYSTINFSNAVKVTDAAIKTNLNNLETSMVDAIKDDVKNAYLLDDTNMSEARSESLSEQVNSTLKTKTKNILQSRIQSINAFPQGLTPQQASILSLSLMASVSTLDDLVLMENLDAVVSADIFSTQEVLAIPTKGFFRKIGKFFAKVIKSVAVIVASAAIIVAGAVLGYVDNNSNTNSGTNSKYTPLTGALVGVGVVAKYSKKWWGWVGWTKW